ncbi:hypothetical protein WT27_29645 [Burkholderia territorii]|uniref:Uncharacterized protein n=1 Tax=Burkholderia territorii TaxID=1503055 RepID=A0A125BT62_9BURK|nr:hypothetical protein WT27_29645 [Burkholderia territorii]KVX44888.1 hypothetical protein WT31_24645 [Burkholderia territorii]
MAGAALADAGETAIPACIRVSSRLAPYGFDTRASAMRRRQHGRGGGCLTCALSVTHPRAALTGR